MRRVRYHEFGGPEVLRIEETPVPEPGPGQVLLRAEAIGASWVDTTIRAGTSPFGTWPLPGSPHGDVVGTVERVGDGIDQALVGRRVVALVHRDAYADFAVADASALTEVPDGVNSGDASVLAMPAPVAQVALELGGLAHGETVLVHSVTGGIGHLAVQLARLRGARRVIGTVGSPDKLDAARRLGADVAVCLATPDWTDQVRAAVPDGVDVALDSVGGTVSAATLELLAPLGRLVVYGAASGTLPELSAAALFAVRTVTGFGVEQWRAARPAEHRRVVAEVTARVAAGELRTQVSATVPLAEAARAHTLLEDRSRIGRVLLAP
ncbi:quinone oxidoreductase family protein [Pseudonocardia spinosispora]|uniref:quinone oxidoreductase family protein n=1 Tax=Pseudonocardia spinosispora TaxID=103441 RepID=UPI00040A9C4F|nr:zinc-binding dehydrogenase [Pseudonocardia spinosispora]